MPSMTPFVVVFPKSMNIALGTSTKHDENCTVLPNSILMGHNGQTPKIRDSDNIQSNKFCVDI